MVGKFLRQGQASFATQASLLPAADLVGGFGDDRPYGDGALVGADRHEGEVSRADQHFLLGTWAPARDADAHFHGTVEDAVYRSPYDEDSANRRGILEDKLIHRGSDDADAGMLECRDASRLIHEGHEVTPENRAIEVHVRRLHHIVHFHD